jgi:hypothetical protein
MNTTSVVSHINHIIDLALQVGTTIRVFVSSYKNTPQQMRSVATELHQLCSNPERVEIISSKEYNLRFPYSRIDRRDIEVNSLLRKQVEELSGIIIHVCGFGIFGGSKSL